MNWLGKVQQRVRWEASSREERWCQFLELEEVIARLPERLQQVARMVSERRTEREMATFLGVSRATANNLKMRVLKFLAKELTDPEQKPEILSQYS